MGHHATAVAPIPWTDYLKRKSSSFSSDGVPVKNPTYYYPPRVLDHAYDRFMWLSSKSVLNAEILAQQADFVLSYWVHPDGAVATRAAHQHGIPSAIIVGGSDVLILPKTAGKPRCRVPQAALHEVDAVITVSNQLREATIELGIDEKRVHTVYQGVDGSIFHSDERESDRQRLKIDEPMLLFVGNFVPVKGLDVLLSACALLAQKGVRFRVCLVGDGALRGQLQALAAKLGIAERVSFLGALPQKEIAGWYRAADVTVLSSHSEGIPNVLRESMACGTPFVSTDVGGITEITNDPINRLVPPRDPQALADAIEASLASRRRCTTGDRSTWEDSANCLLSVMAPLCSSRSANIGSGRQKPVVA